MADLKELSMQSTTINNLELSEEPSNAPFKS